MKFFAILVLAVPVLSFTGRPPKSIVCRDPKMAKTRICKKFLESNLEITLDGSKASCPPGFWCDENPRVDNGPPSPHPW